MELKTPLYDKHVAAGGKIVPFAGYLLPVQYGTGVIKEHMAVRTACGLFDVSHMGEFVFTGADALANIQKLVTNDCSDMAIGQVRYSPLCYDNGGFVDDLLVYNPGDGSYVLVVNASNRHKDADWVRAHLFGDMHFEDISDSIAQVALQGPKAGKIIKKLTSEDQIPKKYYSFNKSALVGGIPCVLSRTGYTGESGFEIYCKNEYATRIWDMLLEAGEEYGLIPCGLGARDTLRMEAAMPLYGHEMDETVTPFETGLGFFVKLDKPDFIGKAALEKATQPSRARVGLKITGRGIAREHCDVYCGDALIGHTTSGTHCPYIGAPIAMALVETAYSPIGTQVEVDVRGRRIAAEVIPLPFYTKPKTKKA